MKGPAEGLGDVSTLGDVLIPVVNKLQDIFNQVTVDLKLDLPQVAVVGSQSSGKSSVLEALVGRDFLPRGNDIVTRRPLVLQLVKTPPSANGRPSEWGEFLHAPGKLFHDFDRIRQEVQQETERLVGSNKNVSDKPIRLKIHSPRVLTMTLVDLPGLTRIPVGDQPSNIEQRIREMVLEYIRRPHCIILAVTPANADLATSDALQLAAVADPEGARTIGVLTKLDIMDRGTDASHILRNTHIPLRLGYIGVVLRSQEDINKARPMSEARKAEDAFFSSRLEYRDVLGQCGVTNLARRLNHILVEHIKGLMPGLRRRINEALEQRGAELRSLGDPEPFQSKSARGAYLLQLLCDYAERYAAMLDGRHLDLTMSQQLTGGARVREVFTQQFVPALSRLDPARDLCDAEVLNVIRNGAGVSGNLLVPQEPFELLARRAIGQLLPPALQCCDRVHEELLRIAEQACPPQVARFPYLQRQLAQTVLGFVRSGAEPASQMLRSLVDCEADYINTDHPDFIGGRGAMRSVLMDRASGVRLATGQQAAAMRKDGPDASSAAAGGVRGGKAGSVDGHLKANGPAGGSGAASVGLKGLPDSSHMSDDVLLQPGGLGMQYGHINRRADSEPVMHDMASSSGAVGGTGNTTSTAGSSSGGWFSWLLSSSSSSSTAPAASTSGTSTSPLGYALRPGLGGEEGSIMPVSSASGLPLRPKAQGRLTAVRLSEGEQGEVEVVRKLVESYFDIVRKTLSDQVPKAIMHFMVNYTKRNFQQHLIRSLYRDELLDELLTEADGVVQRRAAARDAVEVLRQAVAALEDLPAELSAGAAAAVGTAGASSTAHTVHIGSAGTGLLLPSSVNGHTTTSSSQPYSNGNGATAADDPSHQQQHQGKGPGSPSAFTAFSGSANGNSAAASAAATYPFGGGASALPPFSYKAPGGLQGGGGSGGGVGEDGGAAAGGGVAGAMAYVDGGVGKAGPAAAALHYEGLAASMHAMTALDKHPSMAAAAAVAASALRPAGVLSGELH